MTAGAPRPTVVLAGASGRIGGAVLRSLESEFNVLAVTRSPARARLGASAPNVTWRRYDLFARTEVRRALRGARALVYLVHSRLPSARLDQARVADMDLLIADNFGRAAALEGLEQIVCLGSMPGAARALHREEIAEALGAHGVPVTQLRAGLVLGGAGAVTTLLARIAVGSPWAVVPNWASKRQQPIALDDLALAVRRCLDLPAEFSASIEVGGPEVTSMRAVVEAFAGALGKPRRVVEPGWLTPRLYRWWLRLLSPGSHPDLVRRIVDAFGVDSTVSDSERPPLVEHPRTIDEALAAGGASGEDPHAATRYEDDATLHDARTVRSIQRFRCPPGRDADWLAATYFEWLKRFLKPFVTCIEDEEGALAVAVRGLRLRLLVLTRQPEHGEPGRVLYFIEGGLLASRRPGTLGRMEFRDVPGGRCSMIAIHDFEPLLPWNFYHVTQAFAHGLVMRAFQRHVAKLACG